MKLNTLDDLLIYEMKDLMDAEKQLVKALPKLAKAANNPELGKALDEHLEQTKNQVKRLEQAFEILESRPGRQSCAAMKGLIEEGNELLQEDAAMDVRDAGLIACAQRVEHYEIAGYGCAVTFAKRLGHRDVASLLEENLSEESAADKKLTQIAEKWVNESAKKAA
jgi:ferritin-like metal-binding protein YciE